MQTCTYCGSELHTEGISITCNFCSAIYSDENRPSTDFKRQTKFTIKKFIGRNEVEKPVHVIQEYHTLDLLLCLRFARKERTDTYNLVRLYNKAGDLDVQVDNMKEASEEAGKMYDYWTRRAWIIENILMERMGYFPERITDEMLEKVRNSSVRASNKDMKISKDRKTHLSDRNL